MQGAEVNSEHSGPNADGPCPPQNVEAELDVEAADTLSVALATRPAHHSPPSAAAASGVSLLPQLIGYTD